MATEDLIIVAIELGSSQVTGIAGKKMPDGSICVQALIQEPSSQFIRRGMVFNLAKSAQCISMIRERLEDRLKKKISQVYVGYGGQGIHSVFNKLTRNFEHEIPLSEDVLKEMEEENLLSTRSTHTILDVVPQQYIVSKEVCSDPIGVLTDSIEAQFMNIVARPSLKANIENCFNEAGLHVAGCMIVPVSEARAILTDSEKRSGCVLVDFGADTTSVVIFKDNVLRYVSVIPLGSANITKDIASCNLDEKEAEQLKLTIGNAINTVETHEEGKESVYQFLDGSSLTKMEFSQIVEARMREILINVANQIRESQLDKNMLLGGAVLTGGGSNLKGLIKAFIKATDISQVRVAKCLSNVTFSKAIALKVPENRLNGATSILNEATQNCCGQDFSEMEHPADIFSQTQEKPKPIEETVQVEEPEVPKEEKKKSMKNFFSKLKVIVEKTVGED